MSPDICCTSIKCKTNQYKVFQMWQHINSYKPDNFCIYLFFNPRKKTDHPDCWKPTSLQENIQCGGIPERKTQPRFELMLAFSVFLPLQPQGQKKEPDKRNVFSKSGLKCVCSV